VAAANGNTIAVDVAKSAVFEIIKNKNNIAENIPPMAVETGKP
jgi:hypothetical protein